MSEQECLAGSSIQGETTMPAAHLAGNYAPVAEELTAYALPVPGQAPAALSGWYLRNGPNPHDAASGHWFFGDGMIHGVRLDEGRATSYRNRWVRTKTFTDGVPLRGEAARPARGRRQHPRRPARAPYARPGRAVLPARAAPVRRQAAAAGQVQPRHRRPVRL